MVAELTTKMQQTEVGEIPEDWEIKELEEVTWINPSKKKLDDSASVSFLTMADISEECQVLNESETVYGKVKGGFSAFAANDILVAKITPCFENGKGAFLSQLKNETGFGSTEFHVLRARDGVVPAYVFHHTRMHSFREAGEMNMVGSAGQKRVPIDFIKSYKIPLPPTPEEQQAIATALNDCDRLITALEALIAKKEVIRQGAMQELLRPKNDWTPVTVSQLGKPYGGLSGKSKADFDKGNCPYIPFMNIMSNPVIDTEYFDYVNISASESQNRAIKGDLFFNGSSETPEDLGMCAVLLQDIPDLYLNSFCFGFRLYPEMKSDGLYLAYFFRSSYGRKVFYGLSQGATRHNLSKTNFLKMEILLPSPDEQSHIAKVLFDMDAEIAALNNRLAKTRLIKTGMMQQLLTGKKRLV